MEADQKRRKITSKTNSGCRSDGGGIIATNYPGDKGFVVDDHILNEILSRLPVKALMRFKSVCKNWRSLVQQDHYFIHLHNIRSEARQDTTTTTTLLMSPVKHCGTVLDTANATTEDIGTEIKMISFTHDHLGGAVVVNSFNTNIPLPISGNKKPLELVSFLHTSILEPVHGLFCFVNLDNYGSVLIYNPSTREKTSWIKTNTSFLLEQIFKDQKLRGVQVDRPHNGTRTIYSCMFGFGFDSTTKEHKVLCIYELKTMDGNGYLMYLEIYCEVMTVGNNIWREMDDDAIPLDMELGSLFRKSVHVNGSIYWMCYDDGPYRNDCIMAFDVRSETFRVIYIPSCILDDLCRLNCFERTKKWTNELVEVDGHIAILDIDGDQCREGDQCRDRHQCAEGDQRINLWIHDEDNKKTNSAANTSSAHCTDPPNWTKESLPMACRWEKINYFAFKAITGTDLIITKSFPKSRPLGYLNCYNRKTKKGYKMQVDMILDPTCHYDITTFFETLAPVERK
ncbi:hypothetical protein MKX01_011629 [Papaver californicum]|nr:hypothetical protein MKX01_011629 [Papaver californicum]